MNSPTQIRELDFSTPAFFRLRPLDGAWLLTNLVGDFIILDNHEYGQLRAGTLEDKDPLYERLAAANLIRVDLDIDELAALFTKRRSRLSRRPALHRVVVTENNRPEDDLPHMDILMAESAMNLILDTASTEVCVTFAGGDPFLNWPVIEHMIDGIELGFEDKPVGVQFTIESSLENLQAHHIDYLVEKKVYISTILNGPQTLHDGTRTQSGAAPFPQLQRALKSLRDAYDAAEHGSGYNYIGASVCITNDSLADVQSIVRTYLALGVDTIGIKTPSSLDSRVEPTTYLKTCEALLNAILEAAIQGGSLISREAAIIATRALNKNDAGPLFPDYPAGPGVESFCIEPTGQICTSEAGRQACKMGSDIFHIGHVSQSSYEELVEHDGVRTMALASVLEGQPGCVNCAYLPYCGVSPEYNLAHQSSLFGRMLESDWCQFMQVLHTFVFRVIKGGTERQKQTLNAWSRRRFDHHFILED